MQIKMLHSMAGVGFSWSPGDVVDVSQAEARRLIKAGFAEFVAAAKPGVETAISKAAASRATRKAAKVAKAAAPAEPPAQ